MGLVVAGMGVTECLLKDLGIELINSGPSFFNSALWERCDEGESFGRWISFGIDEFDHCRGIDKESSRLLAQNLDVG